MRKVTNLKDLSEKVLTGDDVLERKEYEKLKDSVDAELGDYDARQYNIDDEVNEDMKK